MRPDLRQVLALRVALGQIATVRGRRRRCAGRVVGRFVLGLWRAWCSRSWWLYSRRGCCSSRSTGRRSPRLLTTLCTRVRGEPVRKASSAS
jgi:hypothetical protein